ncbi:MAG: hypothetical protein JOZ60_10230 [Verrucomicrobia bacterium]|nr:hypothetical protein [Verrucomicrobiota bacterium]
MAFSKSLATAKSVASKPRTTSFPVRCTKQDVDEAIRLSKPSMVIVLISGAIKLEKLYQQ